MKPKTHKATAKRLKLTKATKGRRMKIMHIAAGRDHFNAREPGSTTRGKRRATHLSESYRKSVKVLVPGVK
jgi:ribosomal protein L35